MRTWGASRGAVGDERGRTGLGTGVYEGHGSPGFGGVNDSSLLFVYRVLGPIIHLINLPSIHPRYTTQPGTSSPCQEISTPRRSQSSQEYLESQGPKKKAKDNNLPPVTHLALLAAPMRKPGFEEPKTFSQAMKTPNANNWRQACIDELSSHEDNGTWSLVDRPPSASVIKGRWVFKVKTTADGTPQRFKARWVAKGFTQRHGLDYDDTYASVVRSSSIKTLLIAAANDWEVKQFDIKTAFLNASLDREVFVEQPHGFAKGNKVCRLRKALYGLKQSPLLWFETISAHLRQYGWTPIPGDECVFQNHDALIVIYVDDLAVAAATSEQIDSVAANLASAFEVTDLGDIHYYLGCRIIRDRSQRKIWILQDGYIASLAKRFNMEDCRPIDTPIDPNVSFTKATDDHTADPNMKNMYQSLIGGLMWPSIISRIDISFATTMLSRFLPNPTEIHISAALRVLRYLISTPDTGLLLDGSSDMTLRAYVDASFGGNADDRRSVGGYVIMLGSSPIAWKSGKQPLVTTSTAEAEYVALSLTTKEVIATARFLQGFDALANTVTWPITIFEDNEPSIKMALSTNGDAAKRTRHIDIRYHFIRQEIAEGRINVEWVSTTDQAADGLTKALNGQQFEHFKGLIGLVQLTLAPAPHPRGG